jgi:hypothetical protein
MFLQFADTAADATIPAWLALDIKKLEGKVTGLPTYNGAETLFDPEQVFEYYSR